MKQQQIDMSQFKHKYANCVSGAELYSDSASITVINDTVNNIVEKGQMGVIMNDNGDVINVFIVSDIDTPNNRFSVIYYENIGQTFDSHKKVTVLLRDNATPLPEIENHPVIRTETFDVNFLQHSIIENFIAGISNKEYNRSKWRMIVSANIDDYMQPFLISPSDLAKRIGVTEKTVRTWLSGDHNLTIERLSDIATELNIEPWQLLQKNKTQ